MSLLSIDGYKLRQLIISGAKKLNQKKDVINSLNVFPVPDGDTGTNMSMTVTAAAQEVSKIKSPNIYEVSKVVATASLKEARGNSGVILSQIFRGFSQALQGKETANAQDIANAFTKAMEVAYKAVMKPKEGTILTISKALSEKSQEVCKKTDDIKEMMEQVISYANSVLDKTIDMLPELKQAGVVDAGGKGLLTIIEGVFSLTDDEDEFLLSGNSIDTTNSYKNTSDVDIKFGYCTEFFINTKQYQEDIEDALKSYLNNIGDSIVVVGDEDFIKVHVHTNNPGDVLERALKIGSIDKIKIENMRIQHTNLIDFSLKQEKDTNNPINKEEFKEFGFVCVSSGDGLNQIFKELGVDQVIEGGQTMNPSTQDFLNSIEKINAKNIFILPNNKNIILSAQQAGELCTDKNVKVISSTTIPQGYSALMSFLDGKSLDENLNRMNQAINSVSTGQVTFAVRDTVVDELNISKDDYISIIDGKIKIVEKDLETSVKKMVEKMINDNVEASLVTIYYGEEVLEEDCERIVEDLQQKFTDMDIEIIKGDQPLYYYIVSVE